MLVSALSVNRTAIIFQLLEITPRSRTKKELTNHIGRLTEMSKCDLLIKNFKN